MVTLKIVNPVEYPRWDLALQAMNGHSFFHSAAWSQVLAESYGYVPRYLVIYEKQKMAGLIPLMEIKSAFTGKRGVSLPFSDYATPVIPAGLSFCSVFERVLAIARQAGWRYLEIRGGDRAPEGLPIFKSYYVHALGLKQNEDDMFKRLRTTTQRNIKRALRDNVTIGRLHSSKAMSDFYHLHCITRKKHGLPPQPAVFFDKIYDHIISTGRGDIFLAYFRGEVIGGGVYFHMGQKALYKYGASDPKYLDLRPNYLLMWEAIKFYARRGFTSFCLGRTEPANRGLLQFKNGWGGRQHMIHYYRYDLRSRKFARGRTSEQGLHTAVFQLMPVGVLKSIGALVYKHIG